MTITVKEARNEYTATAGQTVFNYTFKIFDSTDLNAYVTPLGEDANDSTDLTTAYTVTGLGNEDGGSIIFTVPRTAGELVTIVSDIPSSRAVDYQNNGDFRPTTVNDDFDRVVSIVKKIEDTTNRGLSLPQSQQGPKPLSLSNPEAGKVLLWNASETGVTNGTFEDPGLVLNNISASNIANYTDLVFRSDTNGSAIENMIAGEIDGAVVPAHKAGNIYSTGVTIWRVNSTSGEINLGGGLFARILNYACVRYWRSRRGK